MFAQGDKAMSYRDYLLNATHLMTISADCPTLKEATEEFQKEYLLAILARNRFNQCRAALDIGIHRNTVERLLIKFDLLEKVKERKARARKK